MTRSASDSLGGGGSSQAHFAGADVERFNDQREAHGGVDVALGHVGFEGHEDFMRGLVEQEEATAQQLQARCRTTKW